MTVHISLLILMTINVVINLLCGTVFYIKNFGLFASINNLLLLILLIVIDKIITIRFNNNKKFLKQLYSIEAEVWRYVTVILMDKIENIK